MRGGENMRKMKPLSLTAIILLIIGGLNWGLVGLIDFDLVKAIFGDMTLISRIVYVIVGVAAVYTIFILKDCKPKREIPEK